jgi:hypothetical protein
MIANCFVKLGNFESAAQYAQMAIKADPTLATSHVVLFEAYVRTNDDEKGTLLDFVDALLRIFVVTFFLRPRIHSNPASIPACSYCNPQPPCIHAQRYTRTC